MARQTPPPARGRTRDQNETELARLRKMRAALPADRTTAAHRLDRRMATLESALKTRPAPRPGTGRLQRILIGALLGAASLAVGFLGVILVERFGVL
ncbi:hypothetical protein [Roseospira goensis]|uniref:Uncharacterized protein n=1 Tax=Roseospira goensis TaxID=391922 RepID=A0A7W6RXN1_9PROT|nr:hypothetical protein [Roseospira goensis]MBB4285140.1 hypothetical protein [Roseospira goensis]